MAHDDARPPGEMPAFRPLAARPFETTDRAEPPYDPHRFHLERDPFGSRPDPSFLYTNVELRALYASLLGAIGTTPGLFLLTGESGIGKTALLDRLVHELRTPNCLVITSYRAGLRSEDLIAALTSELVPPDRRSDEQERLDRIREIIAEHGANGRSVVLAIDEAERLGGDVIHALHSLLHLPGGRRGALRLLLVGRPEIRARLEPSTFSGLTDALVLHRELEPLVDDDICCLVWHRLHRAGRSGAHQLFTNSAVAAVARDARGVPGRAVLVCATALRLASIGGQIIITERLIERAAGKLDRPSKHFELQTSDPGPVNRASGLSEIIAPLPDKGWRFRPPGRSLTRTSMVAAAGISAAAVALVVGLSDAGSWASSTAQTLSGSILPPVLSSRLTGKAADGSAGQVVAPQESPDESATASAPPLQSETGDGPTALDAPVTLAGITADGDHPPDSPFPDGISGSSDLGDAVLDQAITAEHGDVLEDARRTADASPAPAPAEEPAPLSAAESVEPVTAPSEEQAAADPEPVEAAADTVTPDAAPDRRAEPGAADSAADDTAAETDHSGTPDRGTASTEAESLPEAAPATADAVPQPLPGAASSAPAVAEPAVAEPAVAEPAVAEPAVAEPAGPEPTGLSAAASAPPAAEPAVLVPVGLLLAAPMPTAVTADDTKSDELPASAPSGSSDAPSASPGASEPQPETTAAEPAAATNADSTEAEPEPPEAATPTISAVLPLSKQDTIRSADPGGETAPPVTPATAAAPAVTPPAPDTRREPAPMSPQLIAQLLKRGDEMLARGDVSAARLLYEYAAAAGDARAATAAGKTYDPAFLREITALGVPPQPDRAAAWYRRAAAAGDAEARARLTKLDDTTRR
jgi:type II secretory pathway predicted ATPase ExeA